ncbi:hypothetical protein D3C76_1799790 [compost metagenome]
MNGFGPFGCKPFRVILAESIGIGSLSPNDESQFVTPIQKAWIFDLLMFPDAVEPHALGQLHIASQVLIGRGR